AQLLGYGDRRSRISAPPGKEKNFTAKPDGGIGVHTQRIYQAAGSRGKFKSARAIGAPRVRSDERNLPGQIRPGRNTGRPRSAARSPGSVRRGIPSGESTDHGEYQRVL